MKWCFKDNQNVNECKKVLFLWVRECAIWASLPITSIDYSVLLRQHHYTENNNLPVWDRTCICRALSLPNTLWQKRHLCLKKGSSLAYWDRSSTEKFRKKNLVIESADSGSFRMNFFLTEKFPFSRHRKIL